jgi:hypothetical protein
MQNTDNKKLVSIIINYTKTELPEQKIDELVERLMQKPNAQDILFLRTLGIPVFGLLTRVAKKNFYEINDAILEQQVSSSDIKKVILWMNRPTKEHFESNAFSKPEENNVESMLTLETRQCGSCKNFKLNNGFNSIGSCQRKLMTVVSGMFVSYKKTRRHVL